MNYNKIRKMDISNGPGVRISIFMQGCSFHCKGCFNEETWDFQKGKELNEDAVNKIIELASPNHISGLSVLGGEPLHPKNIQGTLNLIKKFKQTYPNKTVWVWTGFLFDDIKEDISNIDVLVDGRFDITKADPTLKWKGSKNQRVIDVKKSIKNKKIYLMEE